MEKLGIYGLPFSFPTGVMVEAMIELDPRNKDVFSRKKINDLYFIYQEGIKEGLAPFPKNKLEIKYWMVKEYDLQEHIVTAFLMALKESVDAGKIQNRYLTGKVAEGSTPSIIDKLKLPDLDKLTGTVKFVSIVGVVGIGLYFTWPLLLKLRKRIK